MINHWTFRCKDVSQLISRSMDENMPLRIRMGIRFHLMMCSLCRNYKKQLWIIRKAVEKLDRMESFHDNPMRLPDQVREKLKDLFKDYE
ncbi:MAG: hypothetical protein V2J08_04050 [Desulfotignum sp.]|nr:hypothetical protein [Desulfotignum sp.]